MPGKRIQFDEETWQAIDAVSRLRVGGDSSPRDDVPRAMSCGFTTEHRPVAVSAAGTVRASDERQATRGLPGSVQVSSQ